MLTQDFGKEGYVSIRKRDMEKLTTEVMQLREFLPKVINGDLLDTLRKARQIETRKMYTDTTYCSHSNYN